MTATFTLDANTIGDRCEILVAGEIDIDCAEDFARVGCLALESNAVRRLTVDLTAVTFMDSTGLSALIRMNLAATASSKRFDIRDPSPQVRRLIAMTGLDAVLTLTESTSGGPDSRYEPAP